jgi:hypothetical protein
LAFAVGIALAASAQTAPLPPKPVMIEFDTVPSVELVRDGWDAVGTGTAGATNGGYWQWGHCIPNGGPHDAWSAGWNHPYPDWRVPPPQ